MMCFFDSSKAVCSSSVHTNSVLGLRKVLKGAMMSVTERVKAIWLTSPNQDLMPVMSLGRGKSLTAWTKSVPGFTSSLVTRKPRKSISSCANWNFSLLKMIPARPHLVMNSQVLSKHPWMVSSHSAVSSMHLVWLLMPSVIASNLLVYPSPAAMKPCGAVRYRYRPHGVMTFVLSTSAGSMGTEW